MRLPERPSQGLPPGGDQDGHAKGRWRVWQDLPLRLRIVALLILVSVVFAAIVSLPLLAERQLNEAEYAARLRANEQDQWARAVRDAASPLLVMLAELQSRPELQVFAREADPERFDEAMLVPKLWPSGPDAGVPTIALFSPHGQVLGTNGPAMPPAVLEQLALPPPGLNAVTRVGLVLAAPGELWLGATASVAHDHLVAIYRPPQLIDDLAGDSSQNLFLVSPANAMIATNDPDDWPTLDRLRLRPGDSRTVYTQDGLMRATAAALSGLGGQQIATVIALQPASLWEQRRRLVLLNVAAALILFLGGSALFLYSYVRSALAPLTEVTRVLLALASNESPFSAPVIDIPRRRDEAGMIAHAAGVFRRKAIALTQLRTRAALRVTHQRALIRQEMEALAETLAEPARGEILAEIDLLEATASSAAELADPESLVHQETALAAAFQNLASRVLTQHRQLSDLLTERTRDLAVVSRALEERAELERMRQELEVARKLQLASLPTRFPAFHEGRHFDIQAVMQPASEVGGDFYDFLLIGEDRLAFMIGDASGKGVSAAMLATQVRTLLRSSLSGLARPAAALAFANHAVAADNPNAVFTTAVVGVLDLSTGRLTLASAGHDPPFLLRKGGVAETLSDGLGIALGMLEVAEYEDASLVLEPGDQLLLFTDGVTEALAQDDTFFGQDRLRRALPALSGLSPDRLIDRLRATLSAFMGSKELADDITMLVLDYYGAPRNGLIGEEQNDVFATAS